MYRSMDDEEFWDQVPAGADFLKTLVVQGRENSMLTSIFALGDPTDLNTVGIAVIRNIEPGHFFPRHCHDCERFEVLVQGSFVDGAGNEYAAGDVMVAHNMDMYGPHVAGPEGYTVVEFFGSVLGTYELFWETSRGPKKVNKIEEDARKSGVLVDGQLDLPVRGQPRPMSDKTVRGAAHDSIHNESFWNKVPRPYLQPLVDGSVNSGYDGMAYTMVALGDPDDPETPAATVFKAPAGYVLPRHSHDCYRFEVLIDGSITDEFGVERGVGTVMTASPNEMYGPIVAGPNGYASVEFFSRLIGTYEITWDTPRGPWHDNRLLGTAAPKD
jgi:anti-sigma factor ChrR (cupin superfamily)